MSALDAAERLKEDVSTLLDAGRSTAREYGAAGASFRKLVLSDIALARVALIRGLVFLLLASLMGGTAWVAAMVMIVVGINKLGLAVLWALLIPVVCSSAAAWYAWTISRRTIAFADLDATRRQLAAWFTPTQPISTPSPTGQVNPGPPDPSGEKNPDVAPVEPP
jgi:hypothetical protein